MKLVLNNLHQRFSMPKESLSDGGEFHGSQAEGKYANYFQVGHNILEFVIDFGQSFSDGREEYFHTRIVTSPSYAKELLKVLEDSIDRYESVFGPILEQ
jgi:hypothetical protein